MPQTASPNPETSTQLLERLKAGDEEARGQLIGRYFRPLCRWAHGRLPARARSMSETQDLVQDAILRVLRHLETFEPERPGALHAYLRKAVLNRILDELRAARRGPAGVELDDSLPSIQPSPCEMAASRKTARSSKRRSRNCATRSAS